jgi:ribonucleoside-diphosphate reductase alpha chain
MEHRKLPDIRNGITRKFTCGTDIYLTLNAGADGEPAEIFLKIAKQGSTLSGLMQAWAITVSAALQRGVPWSELRDKYIDMTFEPRDHKYSSLIDAVARNIDELILELREQHLAGTGQQLFEFPEEP